MDPIYKQSEDVVFRKIADEFVLVPIRQKSVDLKSIYTLNDTGAFVWEQIDGKRTAGEIQERLLKEFDTGPAGARADVEELLSTLENLQLIKRS